MAITHLRRAAFLSLEAEAISVAGVVDRYGTDCSICGDAIDMSLTRPDLLSFSIDHIVSLARGGAHVYANVAPAHLLCNMQKGDRALAS
jgi:5-methylcytosine-specific restriction endonuclease McrA